MPMALQLFDQHPPQGQLAGRAGRAGRGVVGHGVDLDVAEETLQAAADDS